MSFFANCWPIFYWKNGNCCIYLRTLAPDIVIAMNIDQISNHLASIITRANHEMGPSLLEIKCSQLAHKGEFFVIFVCLNMYSCAGRYLS